MMYSNIPIDSDVLSRVALANKALPAYACYHYTLIRCINAVDYCSMEVEVNIDLYYNGINEPEPAKTNCPLGYYDCSFCGRCEWL